MTIDMDSGNMAMTVVHHMDCCEPPAREATRPPTHPPGCAHLRCYRVAGEAECPEIPHKNYAKPCIILLSTINALHLCELAVWPVALRIALLCWQPSCRILERNANNVWHVVALCCITFDVGGVL